MLAGVPNEVGTQNWQTHWNLYLHEVLYLSLINHRFDSIQFIEKKSMINACKKKKLSIKQKHPSYFVKLAYFEFA